MLVEGAGQLGREAALFDPVEGEEQRVVHGQDERERFAATQLAGGTAGGIAQLELETQLVLRVLTLDSAGRSQDQRGDDG